MLFRFSAWKISTRLNLMVALAATGIAILTVVFLWSERSLLREERQNALRQDVEIAAGIITSYQRKAAEGAMPVAEAKQRAAAEIKQLRYSGQEYFFIIDSHPHVVMHPIKPELDGSDVTNFKDPDGNFLFQDIVKATRRGGSEDGAGFVFYNWPKPGESQPVAKMTYAKAFKEWDWVLGSGVYIDTLDALFRQRALSFAPGVLALAALLVVFGRLIASSVIHPLNEAIRLARQVAEGDLRQRIIIDRGDELGHLQSALSDMSASLANIVMQVRSGTQTIATASGQIAAGNVDLSGRTEDQASSLEETASSMEELTSTVRQNADNARVANEMAEAAASVARKGGEVVAKVVGTMESINGSSQKIVDIISVIDGIAFQTNILALNAAVEAARAGEAGRGFAVVATEVRTLAQRAAAAAREIKTLIDDSVEKVASGTELVAQAGQTMQEIVESVARVSGIIGEITHASDEQRTGIEQVNLAIGQMDQVTQQNVALVEQAASASESLQEQAQSLAGVVSIFKVEGLPEPAAGKLEVLAGDAVVADTGEDLRPQWRNAA